MKTSIINIRKNPKGFDTYIGRAGMGFSGKFGNPYRWPYHGTREECIAKFKTYFYKRLANDAEFKKDVLELKGKRLGCFCPPRPCHGEVIANYLDRNDAKGSASSSSM